MQTLTDLEDLEKFAIALEQSGRSWVLRTSDREALLRQAARDLTDFRAEHKRRFCDEQPPDPFALLAANQPKGAAFFCTFVGAPISVAMRVLAWRMLIGGELDSLDIHYDRGQSASIRIVIRGDAEPYESTSLWDFQIIRNLGLLAIDGSPFFDGYYVPLQINM